MENRETSTFQTAFVRSLTFRKTGHVPSVKNDKSLFLKILAASAFVIFMFEVPYNAGMYTKYPISWAVATALLFLIGSFFLVFLLTAVIAIFTRRRAHIGFTQIFNVVALSFTQSTIFFSCLHLALAFVDVFDTRAIDFIKYVPSTDPFTKTRHFLFQIGFLAVLIANFFMLFVNMRSMD